MPGRKRSLLYPIDKVTTGLDFLRASLSTSETMRTQLFIVETLGLNTKTKRKG